MIKCNCIPFLRVRRASPPSPQSALKSDPSARTFSLPNLSLSVRAFPLSVSWGRLETRSALVRRSRITMKQKKSKRSPELPEYQMSIGVLLTSSPLSARLSPALPSPSKTASSLFTWASSTQGALTPTKGALRRTFQTAQECATQKDPPLHLSSHLYLKGYCCFLCPCNACATQEFKLDLKKKHTVGTFPSAFNLTSCDTIFS